MLKLKRTCKKAKGLKARIKREEFLDQLKNPAKYAKKEMKGAREILDRIRARSYDQAIIVAKQPKRNITIDKLRKMAGLGL